MKALQQYRHIYFLGIGGIGMSALAKCCLQWGIQVSGYDRQSSPITDRLQEEGAVIHFADDPATIPQIPDLVIYTPAIPAESRIRKYFIEQQVQMVKRSEALEVVTKGIDTIAIAGTHGKTTTSSMVSYLLHATGIEHTALLGGVAVNYDSNFYSTGQHLMVVEADEYDRSFWRLFPKWAIITAMDADHLDIYGTYENMLEGYRQFIRQIQPGGMLLYRSGLEEKIGEELISALKQKNITVQSYGLLQGDTHTSNLHVQDGVWRWDMITDQTALNSLSLLMPGRHNVENAIAAIAMAKAVGADPMMIQQSLPTYKGVSRRFEIRYRDATHVMIDDYAHHPEELSAAIRAAKETFQRPVMGVFQPHLYSRTKDLAAGFAEALDALDIPVLIDIYPAREAPMEGVSSQLIFDLMKNPNKKYLKGDAWIDWIAAQKPEVLMTLGAGDIDKQIPDLIRRIYNK